MNGAFSHLFWLRCSSMAGPIVNGALPQISPNKNHPALRAPHCGTNSPRPSGNPPGRGLDFGCATHTQQSTPAEGAAQGGADPNGIFLNE